MHSPQWVSLSVTPGSGSGTRDLLLNAIFENGSQGVHENGDALITHFPPGTDLESLKEILLHIDADVSVSIENVPPVDWTEKWKGSIGAHELGALVVTPPWLAENYDSAKSIIIDPGMAFGTGEHATTRGVLRLMQSVVRAGDTIADLGAGSAVLSIAAAKLGAKRVYAVEIDEDAIPGAEENVVVNGVQDTVHVFHADALAVLPLVSPLRVIFANIISSVLKALLPAMANALSQDGEMILSGILKEESAEMRHHLAATGWRITAEDSEDIWWSVTIRRA